MKERIRITFYTLVTLLMLAGAGCSVLTPAQASQALTASGTIEATEVAISPQVSGQVTNVLVAEGDTVKKGDVLIKIDGTLLQKQRQAAEAALTGANASVKVAQAALDAAQTQYDQAAAAAVAQDQADLTALLQQKTGTEDKLPSWYYTKEDQIKAAQAEVDAAKINLQATQDNLANIEKNAGSTRFLQAEADLANARANYATASSVLDQSNQASTSSEIRDAAQTALDDAKTALQDAQKAYDDAITTSDAQDVLKARAKATVAQERVNTAQIALLALQTGSYAPQLQTIANSVEQAQAGLEQANAAVQQAQANLDLIDAQIGQLTVSSPLDGVVLTRSIQPGEVMGAGSTGLTIGRLDQLTVTVYIPENQYGQVSLGEQASLSVDSFPGQSFTAVVSRISDQAEFTPRNVQTADQRQTTVYAVELTIQNPQDKLKPGMPADVVFSAGS